MLASWGVFVHRHRWAILILSVLSSGTSLWLVSQGGPFDSALLLDETESGRALALMERDLPSRPLAFDLIFGHPTLTATSAGLSGRGRARRGAAPGPSAGGRRAHGLGHRRGLPRSGCRATAATPGCPWSSGSTPPPWSP